MRPLPRATALRDDEVDPLMESVFRELLADIRENPKDISRAIRPNWIERLGIHSEPSSST